MTEILNGVPPPQKTVNPDTAFALHLLELANAQLAQMTRQLSKMADREPACAKAAILFRGMTNATNKLYEDVLREATTGISLHGANELPPRPT